MKNPLIIALIMLVVGAGGGFYAGMTYSKNQTQNSQSADANGQRGNRGASNGFNRNGGMRPVTGEIISTDQNGITVKLMDGSSKIVLVSSSAQISKAASATKADLSVGQRVAVFGTTNSDGSVTAQNIQINPMMRQSIGSPSASPK